jgi:mercuric ion transport protein
MPSTVRKRLPNSLTGLAGLACALCCVIPALIAAGILGGTA